MLSRLGDWVLSVTLVIVGLGGIGVSLLCKLMLDPALSLVASGGADLKLTTGVVVYIRHVMYWFIPLMSCLVLTCGLYSCIRVLGTLTSRNTSKI